MRYDTKIAIVVRENLATWQKLNVASFLAGGLVGASSELAGEPYQDGSGRFYGPLIRQPVLIFAASAEALKQVLQRAQGRGVRAHLYTHELFTTGNDVDNREAVAAVATADLDLVGLALHAERKEIDKIVKGLKLHD
ncbi:DUF2000 family protein [Bosea sp. RCC_152_1]|jgi:hypothetical protein|uniref:DUF2000 family protein n=1 Tax=unclassified Bosea (in: a-proteobacteria) TaxID=2653178 RepID=UPI001153479E